MSTKSSTGLILNLPLIANHELYAPKEEEYMNNNESKMLRVIEIPQKFEN